MTTKNLKKQINNVAVIGAYLKQILFYNEDCFDESGLTALRFATEGRSDEEAYSWLLHYARQWREQQYADNESADACTYRGRIAARKRYIRRHADGACSIINVWAPSEAVRVHRPKREQGVN